MVQLLILASIGVLVVAAAFFVAHLARLVRHRPDRLSIATLAGFHAGALLAGLLVWRTLKPTGWALPFWTTMQAGVDSETYGHAVEHAAEVLGATVVIASAAGGLLLGATVRAISQRWGFFSAKS